LRYNQMHWVTADELSEHWKEARVWVFLRKGASPEESFKRVMVLPTGVTAFTLSMHAGICPLAYGAPVTIDILNQKKQTVSGPPVSTDRSWVCHLRLENGKWKVVDKVDDGTLRKRHGLQGPIDDAFMDRFLMVRPTGQARSQAVAKWVDGEMAHAVDHWRRQFRGEIQPKDDKLIT